MKEINIVVAEANKIMYVKTINSLSQLYGLVYYPYKKIQIMKDVFLIYSKDAVIKRGPLFKMNMKIKNLYIYGTCVIVARKKDKLVSLNTKQLEKLIETINI